MTRRTRGSADAIPAAKTKQEIPEDAKTFLLSLSGLCKPQDEWFAIPNGAQDSEYKQVGYARNLATCIGIDSSGEGLTQILLKDKPRKVRADEYLKETYGISVCLHRKKIFFVNFRPDCKFDSKMDDPNAELSVPAFCDEAISNARSAIKANTLDLEVVVASFMRELKSSASEYKSVLLHTILPAFNAATGSQVSAEEAIEVVANLQQVTTLVVGPEDAVDVYLSDKNTPSPIVEDDNEPGLTVNTIPLSRQSSVAGNFNQALPIISPTESESGSGIEVVADYRNNNDGTHFNFPTGTSTGESNERIFRVAKQLLSGLKAQFPRKSAKTVQQYEGSGELVWNQLATSTKFAKKGVDYKHNLDIINLMKHAISTQDTKKAIELLVSWIEAHPDRLSWAETVLTELASKNGANRQVAKRIVKKANANDESTDSAIVDSLKSFFDSFPTGGTRKKETQEAIHAVQTAALNNVSDNFMNKVKARLGIREDAAKKAPNRVVQSSTDNKKSYNHKQRKVRCDNKRLASKPYVLAFCHNNSSDRVSKVDTGEFTNVRVKNEDGIVETHPRRRWIDASKKSQVYDMWEESEFAAQFATEYPELGTIGYTIFWENVCKCVKFGTKDMCSDLIMTALEEAARGWEKAIKCKHVKEVLKSCQCEFHKSLRKRKPIDKNSTQSCNNDDDSDDESIAESIDSDDEYLRHVNSALGLRNDREDDRPSWLSSYIHQQGEDMISCTCCAPKEYPELAKCRVPGDTNDMKTPRLIHPDCTRGCKDCGVERLFPAFDQCQMLFPEEESDRRKVSPYAYAQLPTIITQINAHLHLLSISMISIPIL